MLPQAVYAPDEVVKYVFNTFNPSTGAPITLAGTPSIRLTRFRSGVDSEITGNGISLSVDTGADGGAQTGRHVVEIDLDDVNIAAADGDEYGIEINAGTVDGNSIEGVELDRFTVAATGLTSAQISDVENAIFDADYTTHTTADTFGKYVNDMVTRITSTLFSGITSLAEWLGLMAGKQTGDATALTEIKATGAGSGTYDPTTDSQEAVGEDIAEILIDTGTSLDTMIATILDDTQNQIPATLAALDTLIDSIIVAVITNAAGADVSADVAALKTVADAIKAKTDSLTYTVAGKVDANMTHVNEVAVGGAGASGNLWGPA